MTTATEPLTIHVEPDIARVYHAVPEDERTKIDVLFNLFLKVAQQTSLFAADREQAISILKKTMDAMGTDAQAKGLTPDILEAILNEK